MSDLPETCDFCDLEPSEGEELVEVRFGSLPQPDMIRLEGTGSPYRRENRKQVQGRLLIELMQDHPEFDVQLHDIVEEVTAIGGETHLHGSTDGKVGVRLTVYSEANDATADAMLCEGCVDMLHD
jgi:hypothetical protein